jgi:hypothetical protein
MRRFFDPCGGYREKLRRLAGEVLPPAEAARLKSHLATCAGCRNYQDELKRVMEPLVHWEKNFSRLEPSPETLARWAEEFAAATKPDRPIGHTSRRRLLDWGRDMIRPYRRTWAGLAIIWALILAVNLSHRRPATNSPPVPPEMVREFLEQEGFSAEWSGPPRPPSRPPGTGQRPTAWHA